MQLNYTHFTNGKKGFEAMAKSIVKNMVAGLKCSKKEKDIITKRTLEKIKVGDLKIE